jgi:hypothetical protein
MDEWINNMHQFTNLSQKEFNFHIDIFFLHKIDYYQLKECHLKGTIIGHIPNETVKVCKNKAEKVLQKKWKSNWRVLKRWPDATKNDWKSAARVEWKSAAKVTEKVLQKLLKRCCCRLKKASEKGLTQSEKMVRLAGQTVSDRFNRSWTLVQPVSARGFPGEYQPNWSSTQKFSWSPQLS